MTTNDITGDRIRTRASTPEFRENFDRIFKKQFKITYTRDGEYQHETISAANLTEALHRAENADWVLGGWTFLGVERA